MAHPAADTHRSPDILLALAFSGGGTRAAALAYGVLEELAATTVEIDGRPSTLLDQIDIISSVSAGSFTAAYFGLHGRDTFDDFREAFLTRNVQGALIWRLFWPRNWIKMARPGFTRTDLSAEYYDQEIFHGATLGDIRSAGPEIIINATAIQTGDPFRFTPEMFHHLCSDRSAYPVALAVTASSAVPSAFTPVVLESFADGCGHADDHAWIGETLAAERGRTLQGDLARSLTSLLDREQRPFVHLVDGGISDNLGLRGLLERRYRAGDSREQLRRYHREGVRRGLVIVVNATPASSARFDVSSSPPSSLAVFWAANGAMMDRINRDTIHLARETLAEVATELSTDARPVEVALAELRFGGLDDPEERAHLSSLPTGFKLSGEDVDRLRAAGRQLLRQEPHYRAFLRSLAARAR